ncbi:MAG: PucR family transcriptional regulator, partial [Micropruina sp.]
MASGRSWWPAARTRNAISRRLAAASAEMTTAALTEMEERHQWFGGLDAESRSWITLVARAGIDGFADWFASGGDQVNPIGIFDAAPRALMRKITLHQTVDLVRTTIDTLEQQIERLLPRGDRPTLHIAIVHYSREVAFGAAVVYARAAEARGGWDARLEALVVDAVIRGDTDESVLSRASTLGWRSPPGIVVAIGSALETDDAAVDDLRAAATHRGCDILAAPQGDRLVLVLGGRFPDPDAAVKAVAGLSDFFGEGQIVVGSIVAD